MEGARHNIDILMVPKLTATAWPGPGVILTDLKLPPTLPSQVLHFAPTKLDITLLIRKHD